MQWDQEKMMRWGKLIGGAFGYLLGGPWGAVLGVLLGHLVDRGRDLILERGLIGQWSDPWWGSLFGGAGHGGWSGDHEIWDRTAPTPLHQGTIQSLFFRATFALLGRLAKSDGRVCETEIGWAEQVMRESGLSPKRRNEAIDLFNLGKQTDLDLAPLLNQFHQQSGHRANLILLFMEILVQGALVDRRYHQQEAEILQEVAKRLHFPKRNLEQLLRRYRNYYLPIESDRETPLSRAYAILGVEPDASDLELKKGYRRLMSQHHPDKLVARGLPPELLTLAKEKTQEIAGAYEAIVAARSSRDLHP